MKHTLKLELYYSGGWHDLTAADEVYTNIVVTARRNGALLTSKLSPGAAKASLKNTSGKYNPENPLSPLYGLLAVNMPVRITMDGDIVWTGEASEWRPGRQLGDERRTELTATGILGRIGIGIALIMSPLVAAISGASPALYLPLIDGPYATSGASITAGGPSGGWGTAGTSQPGSVDGPQGDDRKLPEFAATPSTAGEPVFTAALPVATGNSWTIDSVFRGVPLATSHGSTLGPWWFTNSLAAGAPVQWSVSCDTFGGPGNVNLIALDSAGTDVVNVNMSAADLDDGRWHHVRVTWSQAGAIGTWQVYADGTLLGSAAATATPGGISSITAYQGSTTTHSSISYGHIAVWDSAASTLTASAATSAMQGMPGEIASTRFQRVCTENSISCGVVTVASDPGRPMGPQRSGTLVETLQECVATDGGIAYEAAATGDLTLATMGALERQTPVLLINTLTDIVSPLDPVVGHGRLRNDVTATRPKGSSARSEVTTGRWATTVVGRYETRIDVNPETDDLLYNYAGLVISHGTVGGVQYEEIILDLDANPTLDLSTLEIGTVVQLTNVPPEDDPEDARLMVVYIEHASGTHRRTVKLGVISAKPWDTEILDTGGWLDCGGCTLAEDLTTTETGADVLISDVCTWTHADGDYDVLIGGERCTVTAVSAVGGTPGALTQTLTLTRSVNGVVKVQTTGTEVHVADPIVLAL